MLKRYLESIEYKITSGEEYNWNSYPNGWYIDHDEFRGSASAIINRVDQSIYEITAANRDYNVGYRWINPLYFDDYKKEAISRNLSYSEMTSGIPWIEVSEEEIFDKISLILKESND